MYSWGDNKFIGRPLSAFSEKKFETQHCASHYYAYLTMSLTMRAYYSTHSTMSFPRNNFWSPSFDITLLICNAYILNNLFTTYTNYVYATFLSIVQEFRECEARRLRDNGMLVFFSKCMSQRRRDIEKTGEGLR